MIKKIIKYFLLFSVLLTGCHTDLHTKRLAMNRLKENSTVTIINNYVELSYSENQGMVFGLLGREESQLKHVVLIALNCSAILFIGFILWRLRRLSWVYHFPFFIMLSGAFGNLISRIQSGHVIDFIHIHWNNVIDWPFLFNVADIWVCIGEILLILLVVFRRNELERVIFSKTKPMM